MDFGEFLSIEVHRRESSGGGGTHPCDEDVHTTIAIVITEAMGHTEGMSRRKTRLRYVREATPTIVLVGVHTSEVAHN